MASKMHLLVALGSLAGGAIVSHDVSADPLIAEGRSLIVTYCADCHAVDPTGDSPHPAAPPFRDLHARYDVELLGEALVEGLVTGHPDMPEFEFDPAQAEAIISYLKSLDADP